MSVDKMIVPYLDHVVALFDVSKGKELIRATISGLQEWCQHHDARIVKAYPFDKNFREVFTNAKVDEYDYVLMSSGKDIPENDLEWVVSYCKKHGIELRFALSDPFIDPLKLGSGLSSQSVAGYQNPSDHSVRTRLGMEAAKQRGVHCGRFKKFCWEHQVAQNINSIRTGNNPTIIASVEEVLGYAKDGLTISEAAERIGTSEVTLKRSLTSIGKYGDYQNLLNKSKNCAIIPSCPIDSERCVRSTSITDDVFLSVGNPIGVSSPMLTMTGAINVLDVITDHGQLDRTIWVKHCDEWTLKAYRVRLTTRDGSVYWDSDNPVRVKDAVLEDRHKTYYNRDGLIYESSRDLHLTFEDGFGIVIPVIMDQPIVVRRGLA